MRGIRRIRGAVSALAVIVALAAAIGACGGGDAGPSGGSSGSGGAEAGVPANGRVAAVTPPHEGTPKRGGKVVYGISGATDNFCPPMGQWSGSGILVAEAVYDTLMVPDHDGRMQPYLAKSVEHDPTYKVWTIELRSGIKFHNGEVLDAAVVKQNIDAWRAGLLLGFVFENVADTEVVDPLTVKVTTKTPWVVFDFYLWADGRVGVAAPAQLADMDTCPTNMIGTGPFELKSFEPRTGSVDVVRNPDYWRKGFPYLDELSFRVQGDGAQLVRGLQGGQFDVIHGSNGRNLETVARMGDRVSVVMTPWGRQTVSHILLNVSKEPFDDPLARKALALAGDQQLVYRIANGTNPRWRTADQVFDTEAMGHVEDAGYPERDVEEARRLAEEYRKKHGKPIEFDLQSVFDPTQRKMAQEVRRQAAEVGILVNLPAATDEGTVITKALSGQVNAFLWANYGGLEPDTMWPWFHSKSPVNLNHIDDPVMDRALVEGRTNPDPEARRKAYETFNRRLSSQTYNIWGVRGQWWVASRSYVHGVEGPALPGPDGEPGSVRPVPMISPVHQLLGLWRS